MMKYFSLIALAGFCFLPLHSAQAGSCGDYHYAQYEASRNPTYRSKYVNSSTRYSAKRGYDRYRNYDYNCGCGCGNRHHRYTQKSNRYSSNNNSYYKKSRSRTYNRYSSSYKTKSKSLYGKTNYGSRSYMKSKTRSRSYSYIPSSSYNY